MRVTLEELMDRLRVGYVLETYQTQPWSHMDVDAGITCSAEVRMDPEGKEVEAELQMMYDTPPAGKRPLEQLMWIHATPQTADKWHVTKMRAKGEDKVGALYGWEEKGCKVFAACVDKLNKGEIPDFDEIMEKIFKEDERFAGRRDGGSSKAPKIRPEQLMDMKKGGF